MKNSTRIPSLIFAAVLLGCALFVPTSEAQIGNTIMQYTFGAPSGNCPNVYTLNTDETNSNLYFCPVPGSAWVKITSGGGAPSLPIYLNSGTPTSQGNECSSITTDTNGNTITTAAALRTIDGSSEGHDVACVVTADATVPTSIGGIVFPYDTTLSSVSATTGGTQGVWNIANPGAVKMILTQTGNTTHANGINFRTATGGTDFRIIEDVALAGNEDLTFIGPSQSDLYMTFNCTAGCATTFANSAGTKQFLMSDGTSDAKTNPGLALVKNHLAHGTTSATNNLDDWNTKTLASGTASVTFNTAWTSAPLCICNNPNQSGSPIACSASATTTTLTLKSGAGTDTVNYLCLGNPY